MTTKELTKEEKQILQPKPTLKGFYEIFDDCVSAHMKCLDCGNQIEFRLVGRTEKLNEKFIRKMVIMRAEEHHECEAIKHKIHSNIKHFFPDLLRGAEKYAEEQYRKVKGLIIAKK